MSEVSNLAVPVTTLNNGVEMPMLGFGVFQIADAAECEKAVTEALAAGYRQIDTASAYGNEEAVGRAIQASGLKRSEVFVTTKVWIDSHGEQATKVAFEQSLERLGFDYLDLYLIHQPYGDVHGAWRAMESLNKDGLIKAIGVSNFHPDRLIDLISFNEIAPAINQIETHPFFQRRKDHALMKEWGVQHQSWAPFAEGRNDIFNNPVLSAIANKYGKSTGQVILKWLLQSDVVAIPKSSRPQRMAENIDIFDFVLDTDDMAAIAALESGASLFFDHRDPERVQWLKTLTDSQ